MDQIELKKKGLCIITTCNNNKEALKTTINSIERQIQQPDMHIVVCKNMNNYDLSVFKKKNRIFIINKDKSLYHAMNIGLNNNNFSHVLFLNSEDKLFNNLCLLNVKKYLNLKKTIVLKTILKNKNHYFYPKKNLFSKKNYLPHSSFIGYLDNNSKKKKFLLNEKVKADGIWMSEIIKKKKTLFVNLYLTVHKLGGISSEPGYSKIFMYNNTFEILKQIIKFFISLFLSKELYYKIIYYYKYSREYKFF